MAVEVGVHGAVEVGEAVALDVGIGVAEGGSQDSVGPWTGRPVNWAGWPPLFPLVPTSPLVETESW